MGNADKTVFVVEDNPKVARDIRLALREAGFRVDVFLSGRSVLHEMEKEKRSAGN